MPSINLTNLEDIQDLSFENFKTAYQSEDYVAADYLRSLLRRGLYD